MNGLNLYHISLGFSCVTRFVLNVFDCSMLRLPYDYNITPKNFLLESLQRKGMPFFEGDFSVYEMSLSKEQGLQRGNGIMLWHDFDRIEHKIAPGWEGKICTVNEKYRYLLARFFDIVQSSASKIFYVSNVQPNLPQYALLEDGFDGMFKLDVEFYFLLNDALLACGAKNFKIALLNRDLDDAAGLARLREQGRENLISRYIGTLNTGNFNKIANSFIPKIHDNTIDAIVGRYTNGCVIEPLCKDVAAVFIDGVFYGEATPYFNGYLFIFKPDGVVWIGALKEGGVRFDNKTQWFKA